MSRTAAVTCNARRLSRSQSYLLWMVSKEGGRGCNLWPWLSGMSEVTFKVMVQWIDVTACTGRLMWTRQGLETGVCHPRVLRDCSSLTVQLLMVSTSTWWGIHCAHSFNSSTTNTTGSPISPSWCQGIPQCEFPSPVDRRWGSTEFLHVRSI
jgi:hypothetical protein